MFHETMRELKLWSLFLLISLRTVVSVFPSAKTKNCRDFFTGKCVNKKWNTSVSYKNPISWICIGKFGLLELNCSNTGTNKTREQEIFPCCKATITADHRIERYHKVKCVQDEIKCQSCDRMKSREWRCQWNSTLIRIYPFEAVLLHRNCNGASVPSTHVCIDSSQNGNGRYKETALNPSRNQNVDCHKNVTCTERFSVQMEGNLTFWSCTDGLIHIYMTCMRPDTVSELAIASVCCAFHIQAPNYKSTKRTAYCQVIYSNKETPAWDCKLESATLRIFTEKVGTLTNCSSTGGDNSRNRCTDNIDFGVTTAVPLVYKSTTPDSIIPTLSSISTTPGVHRTNAPGRHNTTTLGHHRTATLESYKTTALRHHKITTPGTPVTKESHIYFVSTNYVSPTTQGSHISKTARSYTTLTPRSYISTTLKSHNVTSPSKPSRPSAVNTKQPLLISISVGGGNKDLNTKNGVLAINETMRAYGEALAEDVTLFNCTAVSVQKILLKVEDRLPPLLRDIINSSITGAISIIGKIIELHAVITSNLNKTIEIPDPTKNTERSQASLRLSPGFIDIKHDRLGIISVVFKFDALCNDIQGLTVDSSGTKSSSLKAPMVTITAMTKKGSLKILQNNATITFRTKSHGKTKNCVFLNRSSGSAVSKPFWSGSGLTYVGSLDQNSTTCLTNHFTSFAVLVSYQEYQLPSSEKKALDLITKAGCGLAIICLVACIFTFACVRGLSVLRYRIHLNLCISLTAALLLFITGIEATDIKGVCVAVAIMLHYFFTASFAWMCVEAIHLFTKVVSVFNTHTIRMRYYVTLGWGFPAVIVLISLVANFKGYSTSKLCWLSLEDDSSLAFIVPVIIIVLINTAVLIAVIAVRVSLKGNPLTPNEDRKFAAALKTVLILFPLLGLSWLFGLIGVVTRRKPFIYAFVFLSTLQGVFILLFHCIGNAEVRTALKQVKKRHSLSSSIRNEQKNKSKDCPLKGTSDNMTENTEKKGLLAKCLSVPRDDRRQTAPSTAV